MVLCGGAGLRARPRGYRSRVMADESEQDDHEFAAGASPPGAVPPDAEPDPGGSGTGSSGAGEAQPRPAKDRDQWVTGEEPMTGPQASYLRTLCQESGEEFDETLTKAQASERIDELQRRTGRGS